MKAFSLIVLLMFSVEVVADYSERFCYDPATGRGFISFVKCRGIEKEDTVIYHSISYFETTNPAKKLTTTTVLSELS